MKAPGRRRLAWGAAILLAALLLAALALVWTLPGRVAARVRAAAAARGLTASWHALAPAPPFGVRVTALTVTRRAGGETVFTADTLTAALDPLALLRFAPRLTRVELMGATVVAGGGGGADPDTLVPEAEPPRRAGDTERAARVRAAAATLVRLLAAPARSLPHLTLRDVTVTRPAPPAEDGEEADDEVAGVHFASLALTRARDGVMLTAAGTLRVAPPVPFAATLAYAHDDRMRGQARFSIAGRDGAPAETLRIALDGIVRQDRRAGRVTIAAPTRLEIGSLRFRLGGQIDRRGPRFQIAADAESLTAGQWHESLPGAVLGPLRDVAVRGSYGWHLRLDVDLSRPDDVELAADVVPHGLALDPARTRLPLLGLEQPFTARIHLPRGRIVERELSFANRHFLPLPAIDTLLTRAVLTNEDGSFYRHGGFNLEAVRGAIADNLKAGAFRRGAGTITMQLVRNLYLGHARTLARKGQEVVLAWILEHLTPVTKERMLEIYLNIIEWGPGVHGADEAAWYYLGHDAGQLTVDEALFLATVVPAPARWRWRFDATGALRPYARAQMHFIGRAMVARGWLDPASLPPADSLRVELAGPARQVVVPATEPSPLVPPSDSGEA